MERCGVAALSIAIFLALFDFGNCIKCYQCTSQSDQSCGDPFKYTKPVADCMSQDSISFNQIYLRTVLTPEVLQNVVGAPRYCHKIVMETGAVVRTCLDGNPNDMNHTCRSLDVYSTNLPASDIGKRIRYCSVCDKDNCNGASTMGISLPLGMLTLVLAYFFCKE